MASSFSHTAMRLLLSCAEAIEDGDLKSADAFLHNILILADERPYNCRGLSRVVKRFADALVRRAYGLHPPSSDFTYPMDPAMYYHYNDYGINAAIRNVIKNALLGKRRLHLVDFSIPYYNFEGSVLCTLPIFSGDPLSVRVSYILPPFLKKHVNVSRQMEFLTNEARRVNVKLEDELKVVYANNLAEVEECELDFKSSREDEMVVVYYKFKLHKLVTDARAMKRELVRLRQINPTVVIMLDFYANHSHSNFLTCLEDSLQYYSNTVDPRNYARVYLGNEYEWECNRDASEGNNVIRRHPTLSEWQRLFSMGDFTRIPLIHNKDNLPHRSWLEIMREEEECWILGYNQLPMFSLSAWKPRVEDIHLNSNSSDHKFGQGFNPNPSPLHPLQPFPEGLVLNRLAALAEIHDILKDLCCRHKISLALTWASKVNNINEIISDPNKKQTFLIQSSSCYAEDYNSYQIMNLREGDITKPLIVEEALESRDDYRFEPSVPQLDVERQSL